MYETIVDVIPGFHYRMDDVGRVLHQFAANDADLVLSVLNDGHLLKRKHCRRGLEIHMEGSNVKATLLNSDLMPAYLRVKDLLDNINGPDYPSVL